LGGGITNAGDGATAELDADEGFKLGSDGFIDLSAGYHHHDFTNRSGLDPRTNYTIRGKANADPASDVETVGYNAEKPLGGDVVFYSFGTFGYRFGEQYQSFRLGSIAPKEWPDGFFPVLTNSEYDFEATAGLKGKTSFGWDWDLSTDYGRDQDRIHTIDSANPSEFTATGIPQTKFDDGEFVSSQLVTTLDLRKDLATGLWAAPLNIALGVEHRYETWQLLAGEPNSYLLGGGQGAAGWSPAAAASPWRNVVGTYVDLSTHFTPQWQVDAAGRFENYSDVGSGETGKVSTRYDFSPLLGIRGAVDNGYHAPTLAQEHYSSISTPSPTAASALLPVDSPGARLLGAPPLKPEDSVDYSVGFVSEPIDKMHVTVDGYQIDMGNRIIDTGTLTGPLALAAINAQGIPAPFGVSPANFSATFFTNGVNTQTRGLDADVDYRSDFGSVGTVKWTLAGNYNTTKITDFHQSPGVLSAAHVSLFTPTVISYLTTATPKTKISLAANYVKGDWEVTLRETRYGDASEMIDPVGNGKNFYKQWTAPAFITDLDVSYYVTDTVKFTLGANNLFNKLPARVPTISTGATNTQIYAAFTPYGFDGGYYYTKITLNY